MLHCAKLLIEGFALVAIPPEAVCSLMPWPSFQSLGTGFHRQVPGTTDAMTLGRMGVMGTQVYPPLGLFIADSQLAGRAGFFHGFRQ